MPGALFWAVVALSLACIVHLWAKAGGSRVKKSVWTAVLLVPVMGPLFYGAIYDAPSEQDEGDQAKETDTDSDDGIGDA